MNTLHAESVFKNNNTERAAQPVNVQRQRVKFHTKVVCGRLMIAL